MATKKKAAPKKKRTMSAAQKRALAKGRAALAKKRKATTKRKPAAKKKTAAKKPAAKRKTVAKKAATKKTTTKRKTTVKKSTAGGNSMAKKKRKTSVKRAASSAGRKAGAFLRGSNATGMLKNAGLAIAGGVGAGMLVSKVPIADKRVKSALPIVAGIVLNGTLGKRNKLVSGVAEGMVILGAVSLFKSLAPNVPFLAGDDPQYFIPAGYPWTPPGAPALPDETGMTGEPVRIGEMVDMGADEYYSPADL